MATLWLFQSKWCSMLRHSMVFAFAFFAQTTVFANPAGGTVEAGSAIISQTSTYTQINQTSQTAIIHWESFNIGAQEKTQFIQPNTSSIALNRINPQQGASQILGQLQANGQIILVNQAGIFFGAGSKVNVASIIASTSDISNDHFLAGNYIFDQPSPYNSAVVNQGTLIAAKNGLVALIGTGVSNEGVIQARLGNVVLASGNKFTLSLASDGLINFTVDEQTRSAGIDKNGNPLRDAVSNSGTIMADGGTILMTAKVARNVVDNVINMQGVAQARSVYKSKGQIVLSGGRSGIVSVAGKMKVSGGRHSSGGTIKIAGENINLLGSAVLNANGGMGGGQILVGGNAYGTGFGSNALNTIVHAGAVLSANAIYSGNGGKIIVWSDNNTQFYGSINARGGALNGNGGFAETSGHYLNVTNARVNLSALNGSTGNWLLDPSDITICTACTTTAGFASNTYNNGSVNSNLLVTDLTAQLANANIIVQTTNTGSGGNGDIIVATPVTWSSMNTLTLSAFNKIFINAAITALNGGLNLIAANVAQSITSGSAVSPSVTGVTAAINVANFNLQQGQWFQNANPSGGTNSLPVFNVTNNFQIAAGAIPTTTAQFLRVYSGAGTAGNPYQLIDIYGIQGIASNATTLSNAWQLKNSIDAAITIQWNNGAGFIPIGNGITLFSGSFNGQGNVIDQLYIFAPTLIYVGLFGNVSAPTIQQIGLTNINVTGGDNTGGLVGNATGNVTISKAFTTGAVTGNRINSYNAAGGLVGVMIAAGGTITNSYSTADVSTAVQQTTGGLVGYNVGTITNSYSSGLISTFSATAPAGIAYYGGGAIVNSYWDTQTSGVASNTGGTGLTTAQALQQSSYVGFDFTNVWYSVNGSTRPILRSEYSTTIYNAHQLQLMALNPAASYTLGKNVNASIITNPAEIWGTSITSGAGFVPVGNSITAFTGSLNGQGYIVDQLYINNSTNNNGVGLFGKTTGATIQNIGMTNAAIYGGDIVGGLVGNATGATVISDTYITGTVSGNRTGSTFGVGGLVGVNAGMVTNSYSMASVTAYGSNSNNMGGLIGLLSGTVSHSYSTGSVSGQGALGGLIGNNNGTITRSFWDTATSGQGSGTGAGSSTGSSGGCFGATVCDNGGTFDLSLQSTYNGWSFGTVPASGHWFILNGQTRPFLQAEYNKTISNTHQLQLISMEPTAIYILANNIDASNTRNLADSWGTSHLSGAGFVPIGSNVTAFTGNLNGQGYFIDQLYINNSANNNGVGLFGNANSSIIQNLFLTNINITGGDKVGGIVGNASGATVINNAYVTGTITGNRTGSSVGVGGLAGILSGNINDSYSLASVIANGSHTTAGGLIGLLQSGIISRSYSTGSVSGTGNTGGFIGIKNSGALNNNFWDTATSGQSSGISSGASSGLTGGCFGATSCAKGGTVNLSLQATYTGWSFGSVPNSATWFIMNNLTRPILQKEFSPTVSNAHQLELINFSLKTSYVLSNNINASGTINAAEIGGNTGFIPIGNVTSTFLGNFNGKNYIIDGLYMNVTKNINTDAGLFGATGPGGSFSYGATIRNVGVTNANINVSASTGANNFGILVGTLSQYAGLLNSYATGIINVTGVSAYVGGLIGASAGLILNNYVNATVNFSGSSSPGIGGLLGLNVLNGYVTQSYSMGNLNVNASGGVLNTPIGGFIGLQVSSNPVTDNYSLMNVTVNATGARVGGFAGQNQPFSSFTGVINNSYSTGKISVLAGNSVGGFVGQNLANATLSNNFWDTATSGIGGTGYGINSGPAPTNLRGGCFGSTTCTNGGTFDLSLQSTYTGLTFGSTPASAVWYISNGQTRPLLQMEYSTRISNAHQLQLIAMRPSANYTMTSNIDASGTTNMVDVWGTSLTSGAGFLPIASFAGQLNGQNYMINDLYIKRGTSSNVGLIGQINSGASVRNLVLRGVNITGGSAVGGLAGSNLGNISQVITVGNVIGTGTQIGGLVGSNSGGSIIYSTSAVTITGSSISAVGGLVGANLSSGSIANSYSAGTITIAGGSNSNIGGLVGQNTSGAIATNSYSKTKITAVNTTNIGGFVGLNSATINNAFSAAPIVGTGLINVGAFAGNNNSTINSVFWDTDVSGLVNGAGIGTLSNASGGCFNGACVNGGSVNLFQQNTYSNSPYNWNLSSTWGINNNQAYPYLRNLTQWLIAGTSPVANAAVKLVVNGSVLQTVTTDSNNAYTFIMNKYSMANTVPFLVYLSGSTKGNVITANVTNGNSITDLALAINTLLVGGSYIPSAILSNTSLITALGNLSDTTILYSATANNLTLNNGISFNLSAPTVYHLNGLVTTNNANVNFNGPVNLLDNMILTTQSSNSITFAKSLDGAFNILFNGTGTIIFSGIVGGSTALASLVSNSPVFINSGGITTTGNQFYSAPISLSVNTTLRTNSGNIIVNQGVLGGKGLSLTGVQNNIFTLAGPFALNTLTVTGNAGVNSLVLATTDNQIWNITGNNSGNIAAIHGITNSFDFSHIQNLTGGSGSNNFIFSDNASVDGLLKGGTDVNKINRLSYNLYSTPITITLSDTNAGITQNNADSVITQFTEINSLIANSNVSGINTHLGDTSLPLKNLLVLPNKVNTLVVTGAGAGTLNDPIYYSGFVNGFVSLSGHDNLLFDLGYAVPFTAHYFTLNNQNVSYAFINGQGYYYINFPFAQGTVPLLSSSEQTQVANSVPNIIWQVDHLGLSVISTFNEKNILASIIKQQQAIDQQIAANLTISLNCSCPVNTKCVAHGKSI